MSPLAAWLTLAACLFAMMLIRTHLATREADPWTKKNAPQRIAVIVVGGVVLFLVVLLIVHLIGAAAVVAQRMK